MRRQHVLSLIRIFLLAGALALLGACFLLVPSLTIVNSSSGEIVLITWTDDSGDIHSFGPDLVSDFGQTVPGFMSGGSETMDVLGEWMTQDTITTDYLDDITFTVTDNTIIAPAGVAASQSAGPMRLADAVALVRSQAASSR
jgi:hypothetical protein